MLVPLERLEVNDEVIFDREDGVAGQIGVVFGEDLVHDRFVVRVADLGEVSLGVGIRFCKWVERVGRGKGRREWYHEVDVRWAHGVPVEELEERAGGACGGGDGY